MTFEAKDAGGRDERARHVLVDNHSFAVRTALEFWMLGVSLFIALAIPAIADLVQTFDDQVYEFAVRIEVDPLVWVARALDFIGGPWVVTPVIFVVAVYLAWRERWETFSMWVAAMVVSQILVGPVKLLYARPRPPFPLVETNSYSFPSGHATAGAAIAIALVIVLVPAGPARKRFWILAVLFAVTMALSRVYLRAHWMSDAVAGASMGTAAALSAALVVQQIWNRRESSGS